MAEMTWADRIANYEKVMKFGKHLFVTPGGQCVGTMVLGNDYRVKSGYYGGYPATYLRRMAALFPDKISVLHLCSGMVDLEAFPGDTVDINPDLKPTYVADAQNMEGCVPLKAYDLVLADPPYSVEDAEHYKAPMVNRNRMMEQLVGVSSGTHVVWLDQALPMYRKDTWAVDAMIGMWKSTNHRFRGITVFRRK